MAKPRKKSVAAKPPAKQSKKPAKEAALASTKPSLTRSSAVALSWLFGCLLISLFLLLGRSNIGGRLPVEFYHLTAQGVGWLSFTLLPFLIVYLSVKWFRSKPKNRPGYNTYIAAFILLLTVAGALHVFVDPQIARDVAFSGSNGGLVGFTLAWLLSYLFNAWVSFLVLFLASIIALILAFNITFADIWRCLKKFCEDIKSNKSSQPKPPVKPTVKGQPQRPKKFKLKESVPVSKGLKKAKEVVKTSSASTKVTADSKDSDWQLPPLDLLNYQQDKADAGDIQANAEIIRDTLANFNIDVEMEGANVGPRVTQYTLRPPSGIKLSRLLSLESNIALDLAATSIRMEAPIPGKRAVGIEVPNKKPATVWISSLFASKTWRKTKPNTLAFCLGQNLSGETEVVYLEKLPHLLIAGQTGSGKSVAINILLTSLLYRHSPDELKLIMVDPKQVELGPYNGIPHLLTPIITAPEKCISALKWTVAEMERRLKVFARVSKRNIAEYNSLKDEQDMPYIVVVIDELADLMMVAARDVETLIVRIAQKARAAGIHLVLATQRPSVDVITGLIKANVPARVAFTTASQVDSRTILDQIGSEKLLGAGDMLYMTASTPKPKRLQGAFMTEKETEKICDFLRHQLPPQYDDEVVSQEVVISGGRQDVLSSIGQGEQQDQLFRQAVEAVIAAGKASTSLLQRRLRIGYARAARLIESLEEQGIIGPADGSRPRDVLRNDIDEIFNPSATDQQQEDELAQDILGESDSDRLADN